MTERVGTLRQFEQAHRARAIADYGITGAEYDRHYPAGCRRDSWVRAIEEFVRNGGTLTRFEADSLHREGVPVFRFLRSYPDALPEGYLTPDVRRLNTEAPKLYAHLKNRRQAA